MEPAWIRPTELIDNYQKAGKSIKIHWIEIRMEREGRVASIAIKPTPQLEKKDIRVLCKLQ